MDIPIGGRIELLVHELPGLHGPAEVFPELLLDAAHADPAAVAGLEDVVEGQRPVEEAHPAAGRLGPCQHVFQPGGQQVHHPVAHGDVHVLSAARGLAGHQGGQDGHGGVQPAPGEVRHDIAGNRRGRTRPADNTQHSADGDVVDVVTHLIHIGSVLPIAADGAEHDAGIDRAEGLVIAAQPLDHPGPEAFHEHVRLRHQLVEHLAALAGFQVEHHAALVAPQGVEGVFPAPVPLRPRAVHFRNSA